MRKQGGCVHDGKYCGMVWCDVVRCDYEGTVVAGRLTSVGGHEGWSGGVAGWWGVWLLRRRSRRCMWRVSESLSLR